MTALVVVAAVAIAMLISRSRHPPAFDAPRPTRSQAPADGVYRVLVVADESLGNRVVTEELLPRAGGGRLEAFVVAPELRSRLAHWTGDDSEHGHAERHLGETLSAFEAAGIPANGTVGSDDPIQAADDALRTFPADELVFVTGTEANWLEDDALDLPAGATASRSRTSARRRSRLKARLASSTCPRTCTRRAAAPRKTRHRCAQMPIASSERLSYPTA